MSLGTTIRRLRKARNLTQHALSAITHIPQGKISQYETDKTVPSLRTASTLAQALHTTVDALLWEEDT
nr:helix-turn-helix transcriptional regulator [Maliibacterium massiliense]